MNNINKNNEVLNTNISNTSKVIHNNIPSTNSDKKSPKVEQVGIKGENVNIKADNVYIINNNFNEPVNINNNYHNNYYNTYPYNCSPYYSNFQNFYNLFFYNPLSNALNPGIFNYFYFTSLFNPYFYSYLLPLNIYLSLFNICRFF